MISVVVPCYNAAEFVDGCITSLKRQDAEFFEVVLVDDGSEDDTCQRIEQEIAGDDRFRLVRKAHQGVSAARNRGIQEASGRYLSFIDADDQVMPDYISSLWRDSNEGDVDLVVQAVIHIFENEQVVISPRKEGRFDLSPDYESLFSNMDMAAMGSVCGKLFRKDLIESENLRFLTELRMCEDQNFVIQYLCAAQSVYLSRTSNYQYIARNGSGSMCLCPYSIESANFLLMDIYWHDLLQHYPCISLQKSYSEFVGSFQHRTLFAAMNHPDSRKSAWRDHYESRLLPVYLRNYHPVTRFTRLLHSCISRHWYHAFYEAMRLAAWYYSIHYNYIKA